MSSSFGEALLRLWPNGDARIKNLRAGMIANATEAFRIYGFDNPLVLAHFMAQISHECGAGQEVVENLNYNAGRLMQVWPSRFPTMVSAQPFAGNPRALANKVYNGRMGNAIGTDDGWTFRGRGASQTTGREGYRKLGAAVGLDLLNNPDLVNDPRYFLLCGAADFVLCGCLPFAKADDVLNVTRRLNGGTVGLIQRRQWLAKWKSALGDGPVVLTSQSPTALPTAPIKPTPIKPAPIPATGISKPGRESLVASAIGLFARLIATFRKK